MRRRAFAHALVLVLLAACAAVPRVQRDPQPFDLLGRVLVSYGEGAVTANVRWHHAAAQDEIWLMTPTGQTLAHIVDTGAEATLTRADQKQYRARSVESLTRQALGWALPLTELQYWVRGQPVPGVPVTNLERGAGERVLALTQNGWRVALGYAQDGEQPRVRRLELTDGTHEIRFVIDTWRDSQAP